MAKPFNDKEEDPLDLPDAFGIRSGREFQFENCGKNPGFLYSKT